MKIQIVLEGVSLYLYLIAILIAFIGISDLLKFTRIFKTTRQGSVSLLVVALGVLIPPALQALVAPYSDTARQALFMLPLVFLIAAVRIKRSS